MKVLYYPPLSVPESSACRTNGHGWLSPEAVYTVCTVCGTQRVRFSDGR